MTTHINIRRLFIRPAVLTTAFCAFVSCYLSPANADILSLSSTSVSTSADDMVVNLATNEVGTGTAAAPGSTVLDLSAGGTLQLEDWAFYNDEPDNGTTAPTVSDPYSAGALNVIFDAEIQLGGDPDTTVASNSGTNGWWDVTDGLGTVFNGDTSLRASRINGSIDLSGFDSGVVYFFSASFENTDTINVESATDSMNAFQQIDDPSGPGGWVRSAAFDNSNGFTTLDWQYRNSDNDGSPGSRARFTGIAVYSTVSAIPEPTAAVLIGLGSLLIGTIRRRVI